MKMNPNHRDPSLLLILFFYLILPIALRPTDHLVSAAHARKRPTTNTATKSSSSNTEYDKRITTIDPSGRLLQVEYAMQAAHRHSRTSTSAAMLLTKSNIGILVHISSIESNEDSARSTEDSNIIATKNGIMRKVHRIDSGTLCLTSGLDGDGRLLIRHLRNVSHRECHYESSSSSVLLGADVRVLARECGRVQHQLTLTPGARPLGVSLTFLGGTRGSAAATDSDGTRAKLGLYQCEAGGGMMEESCECTASGMGQDKLRMDLVELLEALKLKEKEIKSVNDYAVNNSSGNNDDDYSENMMLGKDLIKGVARAVLNQQKPHTSRSVTSKSSKIDEMKRGQGRQVTTVDIYLVRPNSCCRGGIEISSAMSVAEDDLHHVADLLMASD